MTIKISKFDAADYLDTDEDIREYLIEASKGNASDLIKALNTAARAKGMTAVAEQSGATRASLYKSLKADGNPQFSTIVNVAQTFGLKLSLEAA